MSAPTDPFRIALADGRGRVKPPAQDGKVRRSDEIE
jgi:hypothetical protein